MISVPAQALRRVHRAQKKLKMEKKKTNPELLNFDKIIPGFRN